MNSTNWPLRLFVLAILCICVAGGLTAQDKKADMPATGFQADLTGQINYVQKQIMDLEGAIPADKFDWRPGQGVRSIGEVYLHVAFGNYILLKLSGFEAPPEANFSMDMKKWDSQTMDKTKIAGIMKDSFDYLHSVIKKMSNSDLEKKVNIFGTEMTLRSAMMSTLSHLHEHLGQSIAYARMNNIVPPWTAAEQKASDKK
jgi:uncharacterized damage-inducible protein DinB